VRGKLPVEDSNVDDNDDDDDDRDDEDLDPHCLPGDENDGDCMFSMADCEKKYLVVD